MDRARRFFARLRAVVANGKSNTPDQCERMSRSQIRIGICFKLQSVALRGTFSRKLRLSMDL